MHRRQRNRQMRAYPKPKPVVKKAPEEQPFNMDLLVPKPPKENKKKVYETELMRSGYIPSHPESVNIVGASGSGKSVVITWMLKKLYKNYFNEIYLFAFTGKSDSGFKNLNIKDENIYTENLQENLAKLFSKSKKKIEESGFNKSPRILVILEDVSSSPKFIRSKIFTRAFTEARHLNISVWTASHKYKVLSPVARTNSMNLLLFRMPNTETEQVIKDWSPPGYTKKQFKQLVDYAQKPDDVLPRPFLYIKAKEPFKSRYRRGFHQILMLKDMNNR